MIKKGSILVFFAISACTFINYSYLKKINGEKYPDAHGVIVFDSLKIYVNRDGTSSEVHHFLAKVISPSGKEKYADFSFGYITIHDTVFVKKALVIKPDGKIIKVSEKDIEDIPMPVYQGAKFIIPNFRILKIKFPGVEEGASVEFIVERIRRSAPMDSTFNYWETFQAMDPILSKYLEINLPINMQPYWKVFNGSIEHDSLIKRGRVIHRWWSMNVEPVFPEPLMPSLRDIAPKVLITTIPSWRDVSKWYYNLCEGKLKEDSLVKEELKRILSGEKTDYEKLKAIFNYIIKNVRYVETELLGKKGGYAPQSPDFTLKNKFGVCRDKAFLMVSMLRNAGFEKSYMVLTNPFMKVEDFPCPSQFNHAIVALKTDTGWVYFDPTVENTMDFIPPIEDGRQVLISTPEGEKLREIPERPIERNLTISHVKVTIDRNGNATMVRIIRGKGQTDIWIRTLFKMLTERRIKDIFTRSLKRFYPSARVDSIKVKNVDDLDKSVTMTLYITIPDFVTKIGKEWHISRKQSYFMGGGKFNIFSLPRRRYPLVLQCKFYTKTQSVIEFPSFLRVKQIPHNIEKRGDIVEYVKKVKLGKNRIVEEIEMKFLKREISPEEYERVKGIIDEIKEKERKEIILEEKW